METSPEQRPSLAELAKAYRGRADRLVPRGTPAAASGGAIDELALDDAVRRARGHDLDLLESSFSWHLSRTAAVAQAMREAPSPAQAVSLGLAELDAATTRADLMDDILMRCARRLAHTRDARYAEPDEARPVLARLRLPDPPPGTAAEPLARLNRLRDRAAQLTQVVLVTDDQGDWPLVMAPGGALVLVDVPLARERPRPAVPIPRARSSAEANLYIDLTPCPNCGESEFSRNHDLFAGDGELLRRYASPCPGCGTAREFQFRLPANPLPPPPGSGRTWFGDHRVSQLIDAGTWMRLADVNASRHPADRELLAPDELPAARADLDFAAAAMDEVAKFVPPGADTVPESAIWTDLGRREYATEQFRFRQRYILAVRDRYRELLETLAD